VPSLKDIRINKTGISPAFMELTFKLWTQVIPRYNNLSQEKK
jgi:hypothetical protein